MVPINTQYRIQRRYCKRCRIIIKPDISNALHNATLSIRTVIILAYFPMSMGMGIDNVSATMKNVLGIHISEGEAQNIMSQMWDALESEYWKLLDQIQKASYMHMISTLWRINGENHNMWALVTRGEAIFHIAKIKGHEVTLEILGKQNGRDIHDGHSAFETLASKTGHPQQYC